MSMVAWTIYQYDTVLWDADNARGLEGSGKESREYDNRIGIRRL